MFIQWNLSNLIYKQSFSLKLILISISLICYMFFTLCNPAICLFWHKTCVSVTRGGSRTGAPGMCSAVWIFGGFDFVNFDCKTDIYFYCGHHTVFTILCCLFSTVTKTIGYVWMGHHSKPQTPKILLRRDRAPGFEIPGSATCDCWIRQVLLPSVPGIWY